MLFNEIYPPIFEKKQENGAIGKVNPPAYEYYSKK